jgi:riboflavin synthase
MFSGIVVDTADVLKTDEKDGSLFLSVRKPKGAKMQIGDSVSVNGTCLTVQKLGVRDFTLELMPETLKKTSFGKEKPDAVNIELALKAGEAINGHFVQGHIDTVGKIKSISKDGRSKVITVSYPQEFTKLVVPGGSIALDGVSLTVAARAANTCTVSLVSYTTNHTMFKTKKVGEPVNIEFDIIAKYATHYAPNDGGAA